jgi:hypothetical protein
MPAPDVFKQVEAALVRCSTLLIATRDFIEKNPVSEYPVFFDDAECDGGCLAEDAQACNEWHVKKALTALRGLEWRPWEWRPIDEAPDGVKLDVVGCHHPGTTKGWLRGSGYYKSEAVQTGFTHFCILPTPPPQEVEHAG